MEVKEVAREAIKPASPTPHHLRIFKLSLLDQINLPNYVATVYFYKASGGDGVNAEPGKISQRLKSSLSKTLVKYYPLAGRAKDDFSIECNDAGAEYVEAEANGFLSEYLQEPNQKIIRNFFPFKYTDSPVASAGDPLLRVQATFFKCGGLAIANCTHHRLIDGISLSMFLSSWAATAAGADDHRYDPKFVTASIYPATNTFVNFPLHIARAETARFVFTNSKISQLQAKIADAGGERASRVEAVISLLWKCARTTCSPRRPSLLGQGINVRAAAKPPLPENSVGNAVACLSVLTDSENEIDLPDTVRLLRKSKEEFERKGLQILLETECILNIPESVKEKFEKGEIDVFNVSSLVNIPLYEIADFGWGKPVHITVPVYVLSNLVMLLDTNDGEGVEALVSMSPERLLLLKRNRELLAFASVNPPVGAAAASPPLMSSL